MFSPNASCRDTYCDTFPGKISTKNAASSHPTVTRCRGRASSAAPNPSSTTPDASTTKSLSSGSQVGTCAWNSRRFTVRWL